MVRHRECRSPEGGFPAPNSVHIRCEKEFEIGATQIWASVPNSESLIIFQTGCEIGSSVLTGSSPEDAPSFRAGGPTLLGL